MNTIVRIAGVNDEPSPSWDLDEGLDVLDELGIRFIALRAVYGEMVDQMNDDMFLRVADRVKERGFIVTTYLGQVGRTVPDETNRAQDISHITRAVQRADYVGTTQLRTMGYKKGDAETGWFAIAVEMYTAMAEIAAAGNKTLILDDDGDLDQAFWRRSTQSVRLKNNWR